MKKLASILLLTFCLVGCSAEKATISISPLPDKIEIYSDYVKDWFNQESYDYSDMDAHINAKTDLGDNLPLEITWNVENLPKDKVVKYAIQFAEDNHLDRSYETSESKVSLVNYKLNTKYQMKIAVEFDNKVQCSDTFEVTTPDGYFRTITIDGVTNFRDLGDGKKLKQGMIYRSATLTNNTSVDEEHPTSISDEGIKQIKYLHLKKRVDLRKPDEKVDNEPVVIDGGVVNAPLYYGGQNILTYSNSEFNNPETIKNIFLLLADETNYPLDIHCVRGTDRTGCIAYLVKGLLGIDEEMLYRDFLFSNFYNIGSPVKLESIYYATNPNATTRYVNVIHQTEGETLKDKIYNYLSSDKIGLSTENLDSIIRILKA